MFCVKEKKRNEKDSDLDKVKGIFDKSIILEKCEDAMFDTSLLILMGKMWTIKTF